MPLALTPYIEKIISDHLRDHPDVAAIVGRRVVGKTPEDTADPWVKVTQLDGRQVGVPDHLVDFMVQIDCYAGAKRGQPQANLLKRTVRAALDDGLIGGHSDAAVTGVSVTGDTRVPDPDVDNPARERFVLTVTVWAHAA